MDLFAGPSRESIVEQRLKARSETEPTNLPNAAKESDKIAKSEKTTTEKTERKTDKKIDEKTTTEKTKPGTSLKRQRAGRAEPDSQDKKDRTIFVGNVPSTAITDKAVFRELKSLFSAKGEVESVRFRSVAFSTPVSRKAAFIQQQLHPSRDAANAYVVYASRDAVPQALTLNGNVFHAHHLRVDRADEPAARATKRSVFVGNLDFDAGDEGLYEHFGAAGEIEYVRVVRDKKTNVGKGFAYVQFRDAGAVHAALAMHGKEFMGKKLRVMPCKANASSREGQRAAPNMHPAKRRMQKRRK